MPSIVQFFHPGKEHGHDQYRDGEYFKEWNDVDHKRKFILNRGSYIDNTGKHDGPLLFWGEWEPPSQVKKLDMPGRISPREVYPEYVHIPFLPSKDRIKSYQAKGYQNTDPFVFGDGFRYAICRQDSCPVLKDLAKGSLILFGSRVNFRFAIDTVFVVKEARKYTLKTGLDDLGLYAEIVLKMACHGKSLDDGKERTLYTGATYNAPYKDMYGFVPARKYDGQKTGFPRFVMPDAFYITEWARNYFSAWRLGGAGIYEGKGTGIKETPASIDEIVLFWNYLKDSISKNHVLGCHFEMPQAQGSGGAAPGDGRQRSA